MAPVLGVDEDEGDRQCHGKWSFETEPDGSLMPQGSFVHRNTLYRRGIPFLTDGQARVLASEEGVPTLTMHRFGRGMGLYFASFEKTNANTRLLLNLILAAGHEDLSACWLTDNAETECAYYPGSRRLIVVNNSDAPQRTTVRTPGGPSRWSSLRSRQRISPCNAPGGQKRRNLPRSFHIDSCSFSACPGQNPDFS